MSYFDYTPLNRILTAFTRHQFAMDNGLAEAAFLALQYVPLLLGVLLATWVIAPYSVLAAAGLILLGWLFFYYARQTEVQLSRLDMENKPAIFAHLFCTLEGLYSVRAYNAEGRFDSHNLQKIDRYNKAFFAYAEVKAWLSLYVDLLTCLYIYIVILLILFTPTLTVFRGSDAGVAVTNALQLLIFTSWTINAIRDQNNSITSVGELVKYVEEIPSEAPLIVKDNRPSASWPSQGQIEFQDVVLRYHRYGIAILKNVSFTIQPREKVGVVGKTGSGKSTLFISLLRIAELSEGLIAIDDLDISTIGLKDLRSKIAVVPQEPVLFEGTIRTNLDPLDNRTDEEVWRALRSVHLLDKIRNMPQQLEAMIIENGKGFSLGQRQLFCIARAILANCTILLIDEGTNAVDIQTDTLIQETNNKNFAHCTVLKIAHRINTIIDMDKILVMDNGQVVEFDTPKNLLEDTEGVFYNIVQKSDKDAIARLQQRLQDSASRAAEPRVSDVTPGGTVGTARRDMPRSLGTVFDQ
jgi:ABC-type multidrug transport system fused ATPase/permease subunit